MPFNNAGHFARIGKTAGIVLGEHFFTVDSDIENTTRSRYQLHVCMKSLFQLGRQTGGAGFVVSLSAVGNRNVHLAPPSHVFRFIIHYVSEIKKAVLFIFQLFPFLIESPGRMEIRLPPSPGDDRIGDAG